MKQAIVSSILLALCACATDQATQRIPSKLPEVQVKLVFEHSRKNNKDSFRLRYEFDREMQRVCFERDRNIFRKKTWIPPKDSAAKIEVHSQAEMIEAKKDLGFKTVEFLINPHTTHLDFDYEFARHFADGSWAFFDGHFQLMDCQGKHKFNQTLSIQSPYSVYHPTQATETSNQGLEYVLDPKNYYFILTKFPPFRSEKTITFMDRNAPKWQKTLITRYLEELIKTYSQWFDLEKFSRKAPLHAVFSTEDLDNKDAHGVGGGAIANLQAEFATEGYSWRFSSPKNRADLLRVVAHEISHLWGIKRASEKMERWISEGAADLHSYLFLRFHANTPAPILESLISEPIHECKYFLGSQSLHQAITNKPEAKSAYHCGFAVQMLMHVHGWDFREQWKSILNINQTRKVQSEDYFNECSKAIDSEVCLAAKQLIMGTLNPASLDDTWKKLMTHHQIHQIPAAQDFYSVFVTREFLKSSLKKDCENVNLSIQSDIVKIPLKQLALESGKKCKTLPMEDDQVIKIQGFPVSKQMDWLRSAANQCSEAGPQLILLELKKAGKVKLPCPPPQAIQLPDYYKVNIEI